MSKRIRCAIIALVVAVLLAVSWFPVGPYLWDLVDDHVNVPYMRDCRGLGRHPSECR